MVEQTRVEISYPPMRNRRQFLASFVLVLGMPDYGFYPQLFHPLLYDCSDGPSLLLWTGVSRLQTLDGFFQNYGLAYHNGDSLTESWNVWPLVWEDGVHAEVVDWHHDGQLPGPTLRYQPANAPLVPDIFLIGIDPALRVDMQPVPLPESLPM